MIEISANSITKSFGTDLILKDITFSASKGDRIGIIGINGAGKTTLLNILAGIEECDSGDVFVANNSRIGYLRQQLADEDSPANSSSLDADLTVLEIMQRAYEELTANDIEVYESEVQGILRSMAFPDEMHNSLVSKLSGGEKTRLSFAELLMRKPDVMILDEPTNHLDIGTLNWLEQRISAFNGTVILVTHDRYFLDRTVNRILEIDHQILTSYAGTYSDYLEQKNKNYEIELRHFEKQKKEIDKQEELIRKYKERGTEKLAKRAASREKRLEHIERLGKPFSAAHTLKFKLDENTKSGNDVLEINDLSKSFATENGKRVLFSNVNLNLYRGERVCMVGSNGIGKTTLLKILLGKVQSNSGHIRKGQNVRFGYYDQEQKFPNSSRTVIEEMTSTYRKYSEGEMRNILAAFLFTGEMVFREISALSGGEKAKLSLVKMMLSGANTLLLDEPTNHLDIPSREAVENALIDFPGTLIVVSHDRYFLNKVPTRIIELTPEGLLNFPGKYNYYVEKKNEFSSGKQYLRSLTAQASSSAEESKPALSDAAAERLRKKQAETEARRLEKMIADTEANIAQIEKDISQIEEDLTKEEIYSDHEMLANKAERLDELKAELEKAYNLWHELVED